MANIAEIGFKADTSDLTKANAELGKMPGAAAKAEAGSGKLSTTLAKLDATADKFSAAAAGMSSVVNKLSAILEANAAVTSKVATVAAGWGSTAVKVSLNMTKLVTATAGVNAEASKLIGMASGTAGALENEAKAANDAAVANDNLAKSRTKQVAAGNGNFIGPLQPVAAGSAGFIGPIQQTLPVLAQGASALNKYKLSATETLNVMRQVPDVFVTAAMGMSPFMIAIQQGPQILDAFQQAAVRTGTTVGTVLWAALLPLLPYIIAIGVAVGTLAAIFGFAARGISKDTGDVAKGLNLTSEQMQRLKDKGTETGVTLTDTFKGFFVTIGQYLAGTSIFKGLAEAWTATLDFIYKYGVKTIEGIAGTFSGGIAVIKATWKLLPAAMGDAFYQAANASIGAVNWLVNKVIDGVNALGGKLNNIDLGKLTNPFAGSAEAGSAAATSAFAKGWDDGVKAIDAFGSAWEKNAKKIAANRILKDAGHAPKSGNKSDPWGDLVKGAENDITKQKASADAIGMTALAAATLEQKTKLLNEAHSKGIALTDAQRTKIDELAGAYGAAKVAADNAKNLNDIVMGGQKGIDTLKAQGDAIGLVGRALAYQTEMTRLLAEAEAKKLPVTAAVRTEFEKLAGAYANASAANDNKKYYTEAVAAGEENIAMLQAEAASLGMTDAAAAAYMYNQKLLNDERYRGIELSPAEVSSLQAAATAQYALTEKISATREGMQFARDGVKGFVSDLRSGLEQGKGFFQSFGDAVTNILNKITDKLTDLAIDSAFGGGNKSGGFLSGLLSVGASLFGGTTNGFGSGALSGGQFGSSGLGAFGVTANAKGNAFGDNGIVTSPTMFKFAKGAALGQMGEAGPEAVMPLARGPDGSLGVQMHGSGASSGTQRVELVVRAEEGKMFRPTVQAISQDTAVAITREGIQQYDQAMPSRVDQIANDSRVR